MFVFEYFDLVPGDQSRVLAVKDLDIEGKVKLVARVVRENRGRPFVPKCKFSLDGNNGTVYVLLEKAEDADLMMGRSFRADGQYMSFCRVLNMEVLPAADDFYQSALCSKIWPS